MMNLSLLSRRLGPFPVHCTVLLCALWLSSGPPEVAVAQSTAPGTPQPTALLNAPQQLVFAGLRSVAAQGRVQAVKTDASGNLYLLLDQGDGVRLLKTDNAAANVLAQAHLGAAGDLGTGLALDPAGNVYVTGIASSTTFTATGGAAIPNRTGTASFVARFDTALNPVFVSYTGGSRIAASAIAATADAVFVTGIIYAADLPVTSSGVQQTPAFGSPQSGFVERFSSDGATLVYATYLTGALGSTTPTAIVADAADNAYIAGSTTAQGFPTVAALVPDILSNPSGFLTRLDPLGDGYNFSTFVPGPGLTSVAIDSTGQTLLASGSVALGQFPVDTVQMPLTPTTYQVLLKLPRDGSSILSGTLIAPGTQSTVAAAQNGAAWVDGTLSAPLFPMPPLAGSGIGFAARVNAQNMIDQIARFGGLPITNPSFASLPVSLTTLAVDPAGEPIVAGSVQPTASAALLGSETYDLPLRDMPTSALPSALADAKLAPNTCSGSLCAGSAAYMAKLNPTVSTPALSFSEDDAPRIVLRNLGSAAASGLSVTATGANPTSDCGSSLAAGASCNILLGLSGGGAGTITASAVNSTPQTVPFRAFSAPATTLVFSPKELDFGIQSGVSPGVSQTIAVTNLGPSTQTFMSMLDSSVQNGSPFAESSTDCSLAATPNAHILGPNATCHITLSFTAAAVTTGDGFIQADWSIAGRDVLLTAVSQVAALSVSSTEVDFGTQIYNGLRLPRFLYLSNHSYTAVTHTPLALPATSPFTLADTCPSTLQPHGVCRIRIDYLAAQPTSVDATTLTLNQNLVVLLSGQTRPPTSVTGASVNPNLNVSPASISFSGSTVVTGVSASSQPVTIRNTGVTAFPLALSVTGDFSPTTNCGATLAGQQSCLVVLTFAPSQPGTRPGLLSVIAGAGTSTVNVALNGLATTIIAAPNGSLDFGSAPVATPVMRFFKVSQSFSSLSATASGPYRLALIEDVGFGPGQPPASAFTPSVNAACHNCYLGILFQPTAVGPQPGTVLLSSSAGGSAYALALTGTGTATTGLVPTPAAEDFGTMPQHSVSAATLFTLTNQNADGSADIVAPPTLSGDFIFNAAATGAAPCGGTLTYGSSCAVLVSFAPTAFGSRRGALTLPFTGSSGAQTVQAALSGMGSADPGIALNPTALIFNNVPGPTATQQSVTVTNTSSAAVQLGAVSTATSAFTPSSPCAALASGASCTVIVTFQPAAAQVTDTLTIPVTSSGGGNTQTVNYAVPLNGAYTARSAGLQIVPSQATYGPIATDTQGSTRQFTVNNLTSKSLTLAISIPRQFALVSGPCTVLAPNAQCSFRVEFIPLTGGAITGSLLAQATPSDGSPPLSGIGYLEGFGVGQGSLTLTGGLIANNVFNFNQVASGQSATQVFTLVNNSSTGAAPITIRRVTSQPPFSAITACNLPLAPGDKCTVSLTYSPLNQVASGTPSPSSIPDAGQLAIESDAASSPNVLELSGQAGPVDASSPNNTVSLTTFSLSQSSLTFNTTLVGNISAPQTVTLTNTGTVPLHSHSLRLPADFTLSSTCTSVVPGQTCTLAVTSTPQSAGTHVGALEINSDSATSLEFISLLSTAGPSILTLTPQALDFGSVDVGASGTLAVQVTNTSAAPITFASVIGSGDFGAGGDCPASGAALAAYASCTVQMVFTPTTVGPSNGTLSIASSATMLPLQVALTGIGLQSKLAVSPAALAFGSVVLGVGSNQTITLSNTGTAIITQLALTASADYAVSIPCALASLAPGQSCSVQVTFTPAGLGPRNGTLVVTSSDSSSPLTIPLTGSGTPNGGFTLTVNGGSAATVSVRSGQPATYNLTVTPTLGFTGAIALTCAAVTPALYSSCSISPSAITLVSSPQTSVATIMTLASILGSSRLMPPPDAADPASVGAFVCLLLPGALGMWSLRQRLRRRLPVLLALILTACTLVAIGCGSGSDPNLRFAPAGTYQYLVTASSTSGVQNSQTVTLNLTITGR